MLKKIIAAAALAAGVSVSAQAATVTVHGSTTVASNIMMPHKAAIESASGHNLAIVANGSSRGIADLVAGKSNLAMISAPLDATVEKVNKKKPGSVDGSKLQAHQIGETRVAFVVHASNPVKELTLAQVADIMSGKISNWSEVGGPDKKIIVIAETKGGGVRTMVEKELLGGDNIGAAIRELPNAPQVVQVASQVPNAIGVAISNTLTDKVVAVKTDKQITQPLILVSMGDPSPEAAKVIEAARAAGQN